jgi:hypothetical protein
MSKLASALGKKYEENRLSVLTREFTVGTHTFKVKIPTVAQIEKIYNYIKNPDKEAIEKEYQEEFKNLTEEEKAKLNDGTLKQYVINKHGVKYRIVEYIKFLVPEIEGSLDNIEYADIEAEWPLAKQIEIVEKINEVISPDYKEIRSK